MTHLVGTPAQTSPPRPTGRPIQSWLVSLALHTLGILFLALWVAPNFGGVRVERLTAALAPDDVELIDFSLVAPMELPNVNTDSTEIADSVVSVASALEVKPIRFELTADEVGMVQPLEMSALFRRVEPAKLLPGARPRGDRDTADMSQLRYAAGVADAADIVTSAIRREMDGGDTLVVWLLDASISLEQNREMLAEKAASFYKSMNAFNTSRDEYSGQHMLLSSVVAFGQRWGEILRPTRMGAKAVEAMTRVPIDRSGIENVMAAVNRTVRLYRGSRHWNDRLVLVVLTDESGDDLLQLEKTIQLCGEEDVVVHVVGPSAVMGCQKGSQFCQLKQNNTSYSFWLTVNKGPETSLPERFLLPYWHESTLPPWQSDGATAGRLAWFGGSYRERLPSGFGPYALTRLALQTGGSFTMFEPLPREANYQHDLLLEYAPDYGSAEEYLASIQGRPLRQFVADAAAISFTQPQLFTAPRLAFMGSRSPYYPYPVEHYYVSPGDFRDQLGVTLQRERARITRAMEVLARFIAHLQDASIDWEYEYAKEESKRWRASYDLSKGRLLAIQARYMEYLTVSFEIEQVLSPSSNKLTLQPAPMLRNPTAQSLVDEATRVLNRCRQTNAGTPWEYLAWWELEKPFGLRLEQGQIPKPPPRIISGSPRSPQQFSFPKL